MSFAEVQFPNSIAIESIGGPEFLTNIVSLKSGYEQRNINWSSARLSYNIATGIKTKSQLDSLLAFFLARKGSAIGFRFKDWNDYSTTDENLGTGDDSTVEFQLQKTYTSGEASYVREIAKPVYGTIKVYIDDIEQESGFTTDTTTGIITFDTAPSSGEVITSDFEFDVPVRFATDKLDINLNSLESGKIPEIKVIEVRI